MVSDIENILGEQETKEPKKAKEVSAKPKRAKKKVASTRKATIISMRKRTMTVLFEDGSAENVPLRENVNIGDIIEVD